MTDASTLGILQRLVQGLHRHLSEVIRTSAVYLGIAVLVTAGVILAMPGLRGQAVSMHAALLAALAPDSVPADLNDAMIEPALRRDGGVQPATGSFLRAFGARPPSELFRASGASRDQVDAPRSYISRKYKVAYDATGVLVNTVYTTAHKFELDPLLVLAVIAIESRYNPFAESHVGAQGLMQVMTRVHKEKFEPFGGGDGVALDPIANIHVGSQILRDCIRRRGSLEGGLACYVGATGPSDGGYGAKVQAERRRLALAAGIPLAR